jgi:hypothetical protein
LQLLFSLRHRLAVPVPVDHMLVQCRPIPIDAEAWLH